MYVVIELQKTGDQVASLTYNYATRNEADSKFYTIMAAAALSNVPVHSAMVLDQRCVIYQSGIYEHDVQE